MSDLVKIGGILKSCLRSLNQNYKPKFNPKYFNMLKLHCIEVRHEVNSARRSRISSPKFQYSAALPKKGVVLDYLYQSYYAI